MSAVNPRAVEAFARTHPVVDALPRAIVVVDDAGLIVGWNTRAEELYGWSKDETRGRDVREVVGSNISGPANEGQFAEILRGGRWAGDLTIEDREGGTRRVYVHVAPLVGSDGGVVGAVAATEDVTEQRRTEQQARELTEHLELAVSAGHLGTWRWDSRTAVVTWDARLEQIFGLEAGSFDGTFDTYVALLHPNDRQSVLDTVDAAVTAKSSYRVDHRVVWPDGSVRWVQGRGSVTVDEFGEVTGTIGCVGDITETKRAELAAERRALEASEAARRERRLRERLEFLVGLTDASIGSTSHHDFMNRVTEAAVPRLGDWCALHFIPEKGASVELRVAHSDPAKVAWAREMSDRYPFNPAARRGVPAVIRTGVAEFIPEVTSAFIDDAIASSDIAPDEARAVADALAPTSMITVPLATKRGVVGAMQFVNAESGRRFEEDDLALARAAAGRIADTLENMWLTDQHRNISATLQRSLLPPAIPRIPGIEVAVRYWPAGAASEVGGDFYDVFELSDTRWAVLIGDVCGTGPDAAAVSGIARHTLRAAARHGHDHETVLEWINEAVGRSGRDLFCTACYATIDIESPSSIRLTSASAGHPLPVLCTPAGSTTALGRPGTLLGVFDEITTATTTAALGPGSVVVFYTDGVGDLPPPYGLNASEVAALIRKTSAGQSAGGVADGIKSELDARLPDHRRADDIALVVLRVAEVT